MAVAVENAAGEVRVVDGCDYSIGEFVCVKDRPPPCGAADEIPSFRAQPFQVNIMNGLRNTE
jgi:hypothetical protein